MGRGNPVASTLRSAGATRRLTERRERKEGELDGESGPSGVPLLSSRGESGREFGDLQGEMKLLLGAVSALLCCLSRSEPLDAAGRNVCHQARNPSTPVCCSGWLQEGKECTRPVCEGEQACQQDELCVYPGVCRCPPGYFGAQCKSRCPPEFWGSDCRKACPCHPNGRCHPATGECTCNRNRWGPQCQNTCKCALHGHCHPLHGNCSCDEGWWTPTCAKPCQCVSGGSAEPGCEQLTGRCRCLWGHWGLKCRGTCMCHLSPCNAHTGVCECQAGWWGPNCSWKCNCDLTHSSCVPATGLCSCHPGYQGQYCNLPCGTGKYGSGCDRSCGHCKDEQPCSPSDGLCAACDPGWNGTRCDQPCPAGHYGDSCQEACPRCRGNEPCDPKTGRCWRCDPGWTGPRCDERCSDRTYGDGCSFLCSPCIHGNCHHVTGKCVCLPGFQGESCNSSCSALQFGINCSSACECGDAVSCHSVTGACPHSVRGAVLAGVLVPLFLLLLAVLCCCLCCGGAPVDVKDGTSLADAGVSARMKYHVYSVLANIGAALPCVSDWSSGLPRVTVSHHDPELTFNHSFIEPPSSGWVTEGSSFDSDEEEGEALYCVPPREDIPTAAGGEFQEMSSKCNMLLDPSGFSSEDMSSPFSIPRTSSIAKSKRPSVSFAEGTRFSPKERRGSAQDLSGPPRKSKSTWGVLMMSALQSQGGVAKPGEEDGVEAEQAEDEVDAQAADQQETNCEGAEPDGDRNEPLRTSLQVPGASGRRRTMSNTAAHKGHQAPAPCDPSAGAPNKVTTVYMTVGRAGRPVSKLQPSSEGPVQAMLRRLGSLQRKEQAPGRGKPKGAEGITKPPRRKLGARASVWEQGGPTGGDPGISKPIRRKHASPSCPDTAEAPPSDDTPKRPLSSILKSVPELGSIEGGSRPGAAAEPPSVGQLESSYLTVGPAGGAGGLAEVIANQAAMASGAEEPCYENVMIQLS